MAICKSSAPLRFGKQLAAQNARQASAEAFWIPNTDVYILEGNLVIKVELAGIKREDVELSAEGHRLTISGHRPDCCRNTPAKCKFLVMEINYGAFESVIELPAEYDLSQAKAAYQNGFLRIDVPEKDLAPVKNVQVPITDEET